MRIALRLATVLCLLAAPAFAQLGGGATPPAPSTLVKVHAAHVTIAAGGVAQVELELAIEPTWHINANPPSPDYMIPTLVQLKPAFGLSAGKIKYPTPQKLKVEFDPEPLSVYTQAVTIPVPLNAAATAESGMHVLHGTLRFQACNDQVCTAPTTIPFAVAVTVTGGGAVSTSAAGVVDSSNPAVTTTVDTTARAVALPSGGAPITVPEDSDSNNPIAQGGLVGFLFLFGIGLALNLTPCVYPLIGVTLSIFGSRSATSTTKVVGAAVIYVLGMMLMYTVLGVAAGLSGKIFGAYLQNPLVLTGIGLFLMVMSLSMFGLFELQPPSWLLQKLGGGGATDSLGLFVSGLVVGVFAAPCVGPPVVALLALVAAKGDPWFGFSSFFTLSLGLGAPYLVLATSSNLLQKLPRSGDWMLWVKKLFGISMLAYGLHYVLLAFAPRFAPWVVPAALALGGLYLGFIEKSAAKRKNFRLLKRIVGVAGVALSIVLFPTPPKQSLHFRTYDESAVQRALSSGKPVILDFSADWCAPCHRLERETFSNPGVIAAARRFEVFKVDLTHTGSPDVEQRTRQFQIKGVPTVVFLEPGGGEIPGLRFSEFLPASQFLEKMRLAAATGKQG